MASSTPPRAVLNGVTVSFGIITAQVDLISVQESKAKRAKANISTTNLCPTCKGDVPLQHQLRCEHGHGPFASEDARKAVTVSGELTPTTSDAVAEAKAPSIPLKRADLSVFAAVDVETATMASGNLFRLRSDPMPTYGLLLKLVEDRSLAFLCEMVVKGKTCLYRAVAQGGTIVLVELIRPERMLSYEPVETVVDERMLANARRLAEGMIEEFDPADWGDERAVRLAAMSAPTVEPVPARNADVVAATADLVAMLEASPAA